MKIIDLLNKIAKGEEVPKKFIFDDREFYLQSKDCYRCDDTIFEENFILEDLNEELEIIEENKDIEELSEYAYIDEKTGLACGWSFQEEKLKDKINELVSEIRKLKENK